MYSGRKLSRFLAPRLDLFLDLETWRSYEIDGGLSISACLQDLPPRA